MNMQPPLLAVLPSAVLDMTTDFTPLFMGMVIGLCLCVLAFAFAIGAYDTRRARPQVKRPRERTMPVPELPDAA